MTEKTNITKRFGVMRWLNDGQRLSVHDLNQIQEPRKPLNEYKPGDCGVSLYRGYPGLWNFRILAVGGKKEMTSWLDEKFMDLMEDVTDKFLQEGHPDLAPKKQKMQVTVTNTASEVTPRKSGSGTPASVTPSSVTPRKSPRRLESIHKSTTPKKLQSPSSEIPEGNPDLAPKKQKMQVTVPNTASEVTPRKSGSGTPASVTPSSVTPSSVTPRKSPRRLESIHKSTTPKQLQSPSSEIPVSSSSKSLSQSYLKRHSSSSGDKIRKLERDVSSLKERVRNLEKKLLPTVTPTKPVTTTEPQQSTPTEARPQPTHEKEQATTSQGAISVDANIHGDLNIFKHLALKIFSAEELINCSRTGKRTIKNMDKTPRPPLDSSKMSRFLCVVKESLPHYNNETVFKKLENLQKVLRRK